VGTDGSGRSGDEIIRLFLEGGLGYLSIEARQTGTKFVGEAVGHNGPGNILMDADNYIFLCRMRENAGVRDYNQEVPDNRSIATEKARKNSG
jgi:hypothetical protein